MTLLWMEDRHCLDQKTLINTIGYKLKEARLKKNIKLEDMPNVLQRQISKDYVADIECNNIKPSDNYLKLIAPILDLNIDELIKLRDVTEFIDTYEPEWNPIEYSGYKDSYLMLEPNRSFKQLIDDYHIHNKRWLRENYSDTQHKKKELFIEFLQILQTTRDYIILNEELLAPNRKAWDAHFSTLNMLRYNLAYLVDYFSEELEKKRPKAKKKSKKGE